MAGPSRKLAELFYELRAKTEGLKKDTDEAERHLGKLSKFILANPVAAMSALGAAALGVAIKAALMAEKVEGSLKRVAAAVPAGTQGLDVLKRKLAEISVATGRTQEELGAAAEKAARTGAESAEGVAQRLSAATKAADATGEELQSLFGGLDQVLDLFGKSSADAEQSLATLFAAARGKTSLEDLFASFKAAAPALEELDVDLSTAARALVALGERGKSAKQASTELKALAKAGAEGRAEVLKLAESIPAATNPMGELAAAADLANSSGERLAARLREQLNAELIELGDHILPTAVGALQDLLRLFGSGKEASLLKNNVAVITAFGHEVAAAREKTDVLNTSFKEQEHAVRSVAKAVREGEASLKDLGRIELTDLQATLVALSKQRLISPEAKADVTSLLKEIEAIKLAQLAAAPTTGAAGKSRTAKTIEEETDALKAAAKTREALLQVFNEELDEFTRKSKQTSENRRQVFEAERAAMLKLAENAGDAVAVLDLQIDETIGTLRRLGATDAQIAKITAPLEAAKESATALNGAVQHITLPPEVQAQFASAFGDIRKEIEKTRKALKSLGLSPAEINTIIDRQELERVRETLQGLGIPPAQIDAMVGGLKKVGEASHSVAQSILAIGQAVLSTLSALGALDEKAASIGRGAIGIGEGIANFAAGNKVQGGAQVLGGVADLLKGLLGGQSAESKQREREHNEALARLESIKKNTGDLVGISSSGSTINEVTRGVSQLLGTTGAAGGFRKFSEFGVNEAGFLEGATGRSFKEIEELARGLGVTLDGTKQSYLDFLAALKSVDLAGFGEGFAGAMAKLEASFRVEGITDPLEQLQKRIAVLVGPNGAPAFSKALGDINLSSADGRAAAIDALKALFAGMKDLKPEDLGGLSVDEFVRSLLESVDSLRALQPVAEATQSVFERLQARLADLRDEFEALDITDSVDQLAILREALGEFAPAIRDAVGAFDLSSIEGIGNADAAVRSLFQRRAQLTEAERGGLSVDEFTRALLELDRALDAAREKLTAERDKAVDEAAARDAERLKNLDDAAAAAEDARAARVRSLLDNVRRQSEFFDDTTAEAAVRLVSALSGLSPAFATLLDGLDLTSAEGLLVFNQRLGDLFEQFQEGSVAVGDLSFSEFLEQLLALEGGADAAANAIDNLATQTLTLADRLNAALETLDFSLDLGGVTEPLEILKRTVEAIKGIDPRIAKALEGVDLSTPSGQAGAIAKLQALGAGTTDQDLRKEILTILHALRALPSDATATIAAAPGGGGSAHVESAALVTEVTANRMMDFLGQIAANTAGMLAALLGRVQPIALPSIANVGTGGQTFNSAGGVNVNLGGISFPLELAAGATLDFTTFKTMMERDGLPWLKDKLARDLALALNFQGQTKIQ